jgi:hypothetical protein
MSKYILIFAALFGFMGCSIDTIDDIDVNPDRLHGEYQIDFDEAEGFIRHYVQFRVAGPTGTTVRLSEGSISLDGEEMSVFDGDDAFINLQGTYYRRTRSVSTPNPTYLYSWERTDGLVIDNTATMPGAFAVLSPTDADDHTGELTIVLDGEELDANEHYNVTVRSLVDREDAPMVTREVHSGSELTLGSDVMIGFPVGPVSLSVARIRAGRPQSGHDSAGGQIRTTYTASSIYFNIVE